MIAFVNEHTRPALRRMWKTCFDDSERFMDLYFSEKYKDENTLVYFVDNQSVASLQMLPYQFKFHGENIPVSYIMGACTLPKFRGRGLMGELLLASFEVMKTRRIPLSILIPANEHLYQYYQKFGYEKVFFADNVEIPLKEFCKSGDWDISYQAFSDFFKDKDFCIQKTRADFITIIKDAEMDNFSKKTNLDGMAKIIDSAFFACNDVKSLFANKKAILNLMLE